MPPPQGRQLVPQPGAKLARALRGVVRHPVALRPPQTPSSGSASGASPGKSSVTSSGRLAGYASTTPDRRWMRLWPHGTAIGPRSSPRDCDRRAVVPSPWALRSPGSSREFGLGRRTGLTVAAPMAEMRPLRCHALNTGVSPLGA